MKLQSGDWGTKESFSAVQWEAEESLVSSAGRSRGASTCWAKFEPSSFIRDKARRRRLRRPGRLALALGFVHEMLRAALEPPRCRLYKVNSRYIIRHEAETNNFVLCRGAPSLLDYTVLSARNIGASFENNEKYDARVIAGQSGTNFR